MNTRSKGTAPITRVDSRPASAELRLKELGINLPPPTEPFGTNVEAGQTGNLLGMLPTENHPPKFLGRVGGELNADQECEAAYLAALNVLAVRA